MMHPSDGFPGTSRFLVEGRLGAGGMGVVYQVRDVERGETLALKTMARAQPSTLLRFKREFRALADIAHPNVVQLYELFSENDRCFFTMELVLGTDLLTWVASTLSRPPPPLASSSSGATSTVLASTRMLESLRPARVPSDLPPISSRGDSAPFAIRDVDRLRDALSQLAVGLAAIHAAGKLHRDIKPSNVMVTREGRVVLLDFGVVSDVTETRRGREQEPLAGTPAYISPEQTALEPATPASDWYAVGVILYEALAGRLPFDGLPLSVLFRKRQAPPPPPSTYAAGIPEDLERLAMDLLERDPRQRPTSAEVLARLANPSARREDGVETITSIRPPFVGRREELAELREAFDASADGPSVVMLHGPSGIGKSALVSRFLRDLPGEADVVVLSGRCYEREAVPFKAIDPLVDELRRWLGGLPEGEIEAYLPEDLDALARVFPVLGDVGGRASSAAATARDTGEPEELRRRAFAALSDLFAAIARRYRLVVHVDDLQWCDADSVQLLESLFAVAAWAWLFVCSYRSDLASESRPLADLRALLARSRATCRDVPMTELSDGEAQELARELVGTGDVDLAKLVTKEARGNPLFVAELVCWAKERPAGAGDDGFSFERIILDRVAGLSDDARALVEVLSVARGPLAHGVVSTAASLPANKRGLALLLRGARLVTMRGLGDDDPIELAHDRVRETVLRSLPPERRAAYHAGIAQALAASGGGDPEAIFEHARAAGDVDGARAWALPAARAADRSLAFLRAAELYAAAIDLGADASAGRPGDLHARLGDALLHAGQIARAGDAYLAGAEIATDAARRDLLRRAAECYLKSGRDARGVDLLRAVLGEAGLSYPESGARAVASIVWNEATLRVSPLRRRLRSERSVRAEDLERIDVAFSAATGLGLTDPVRGATFAARGLSLALAAGEPRRMCRALAVAATHAAMRGEPGRARAEALVREAEHVAHEVGEPHTLALSLFAAGAVHFFLGEWRTARSALERAEKTFVDGCRGVGWELANARSWICNVLILSGELANAARLVRPLIEEARARDDRFFIVQLVYPGCVASLVADDVAEARATVDLGVSHGGGAWNAGTWGAFISACSVDRYRGAGPTAFERVLRDGPSLDRSPLAHSAMVRVFSAYEAGLSALASASAGVSRWRALRAARRWADDLAREKLRFAPALGLLVEAGVAAVKKDRRGADAALAAAIPRLEEADLGYLASCARHRRGEHVGGSAGRELVERAGAFFAGQGVRRIDRCLAMSSPGFPV